MIVLVITWKELDAVHSQAFGPWTATEDGSYFGEMTAFLSEWAADKTYVAATMYVVTPVPEAI